MTKNINFIKISRASLKGNWGIAITVLVIYLLISGILSLISQEGPTNFALIASIINLICIGPLSLGLATFWLSISRNKGASVEQLFQGFTHFGKSLAAFLLITLFVVLWLFLLIIPGVIAALSYSLTYFILVDDQTISALDAIKKSKKMMYGYKSDLFILYLTILGLFFLSLFTLGIALLWVIPITNVALAKFYEEVKANYLQKKSESKLGKDEESKNQPEPSNEETVIPTALDNKFEEESLKATQDFLHHQLKDLNQETAEQKITEEPKIQTQSEENVQKKVEETPNPSEKTPVFCRGDESIEELLDKISTENTQENKAAAFNKIKLVIESVNPILFQLLIEKLQVIESELMKFILENEAQTKNQTMMEENIPKNDQENLDGNKSSKNSKAALGVSVVGGAAGGVALNMMASNMGWSMSRDGLTFNQLPDQQFETESGTLTLQDSDQDGVYDAPIIDTSSVDVGSASVCEENLDDMTFGEAFAAARQDVGAGGVFVYEGNSYSTYYKEEWDEMSEDDKQEYWASVGNAEEENEYLASTYQDDSVNEDNSESASYTSSSSMAAEEVPLDIDEDGVNESVLVDIDEDGVHDAILTDTDGDGDVDTAIVDTDGDNEPDLIIADTDNDGQADRYAKDTDGDGTFDETGDLSDNDSSQLASNDDDYGSDYDNDSNVDDMV